MSGHISDMPWGLCIIKYFLQRCCPQCGFNKTMWHQGGVLVLTFLAYTSYHLTRKPISVVKNVLNFNCSSMSPPPNFVINETNQDVWCDWAPFNTADAPALLGMLDSAFLFAYAGAMFLSGFIAERVNLRYFLSFGMLASGISCYLFGIARPYNIHSLWYFIIVQIAGGVFQTSGWPGVITVLGNWFGKGKRGLIFGVWNSHTSVGNILGTTIAAKYVETDWGLSFMVPGAVMGIVGFIIFLFLAPSPTDVDCVSAAPLGYRKLYVTTSSDEDNETRDHDNINDTEEDLLTIPSETSPMLSGRRQQHNTIRHSAIGFRGALAIPGVIEYSLSLFFAKLVSYTFLFWLPLYISSSTPYGPSVSAKLSTVFDVGGIIGAIAAGYISDVTGLSALTCACMLLNAVPMLFIYDYVNSDDIGINIVLLLLLGIFVNGPYALITTAVSAELGTHPSLEENSKALATVTAIIDGTGSIGAAVGPLLAGFISQHGWQNVFYMLMAADVTALLLLSKLVYKDIQCFIQQRRVVSSSAN
ncbi:glucose-6-phosphate exchanger SLC37A2 isoform X2 [Prorops nasuta]|uniref:glucose-6-phosphate exchanger SLC37A2 isoform X2 n=1 Tax=Prorops nasuta TaxID=863751 RepID=UPI0034CF5C61